ncbi:hypothetical protein B0I29_101529 [Actinoplanes lutulentus]|uniref:Uncharacterized protein n=1 Tax=Actinoplanes lutulentus TaxID=1287878 RepID=A0A327ZLB0_9ACTN|nr:hypothetical protein B0I29_101529 [Actinoplanes lutulentus]
MQTRAGSGNWVRWRVGRRRLAGMPSKDTWGSLNFADGDIGFVLTMLYLAVVLVIGIAILLATAVVWPYRAITDNWPVVARELDGDDENLQWRWVRGRAAADALAQQWATEIEQHGRPLG